MLEGLLYINFAFNFRSPATDNEWARYKAGDAHVQDIHDVINSCAAHETKRHVAFWTQYLPHLYNSLSAPERTEQFTSSSGWQFFLMKTVSRVSLELSKQPKKCCPHKC